ncbi:uncharacterized protein LOC143276072 [Babylonia areolata]|uniref:uncharacterized protein LOC143276072 n=1 Tax=Babylonia areolata TaxID=304850 RepID=UPI003FD1C96B
MVSVEAARTSFLLIVYLFTHLPPSAHPSHPPFIPTHRDTGQQQQQQQQQHPTPTHSGQTAAVVVPATTTFPASSQSRTPLSASIPLFPRGPPYNARRVGTLTNPAPRFRGFPGSQSVPGFPSSPATIPFHRVFGSGLNSPSPLDLLDQDDDDNDNDDFAVNNSNRNSGRRRTPLLSRRGVTATEEEEEDPRQGLAAERSRHPFSSSLRLNPVPTSRGVTLTRPQEDPFDRGRRGGGLSSLFDTDRARRYSLDAPSTFEKPISKTSLPDVNSPIRLDLSQEELERVAFAANNGQLPPSRGLSAIADQSRPKLTSFLRPGGSPASSSLTKLLPPPPPASLSSSTPAPSSPPSPDTGLPPERSGNSPSQQAERDEGSRNTEQTSPDAAAFGDRNEEPASATQKSRPPPPPPPPPTKRGLGFDEDVSVSDDPGDGPDYNDDKTSTTTKQPDEGDITVKNEALDSVYLSTTEQPDEDDTAVMDDVDESVYSDERTSTPKHLGKDDMLPIDSFNQSVSDQVSTAEQHDKDDIADDASTTDRPGKDDIPPADQPIPGNDSTDLENTVVVDEDGSATQVSNREKVSSSEEQSGRNDSSPEKDIPQTSSDAELTDLGQLPPIDGIIQPPPSDDQQTNSYIPDVDDVPPVEELIPEATQHDVQAPSSSGTHQSLVSLADSVIDHNGFSISFGDLAPADTPEDDDGQPSIYGDVHNSEKVETNITGSIEPETNPGETKAPRRKGTDSEHNSSVDQIQRSENIPDSGVTGIPRADKTPQTPTVVSKTSFSSAAGALVASPDVSGISDSSPDFSPPLSNGSHSHVEAGRTGSREPQPSNHTDNQNEDGEFRGHEEEPQPGSNNQPEDTNDPPNDDSKENLIEHSEEQDDEDTLDHSRSVSTLRDKPSNNTKHDEKAASNRTMDTSHSPSPDRSSHQSSEHSPGLHSEHHPATSSSSSSSVAATSHIVTTPFPDSSTSSSPAPNTDGRDVDSTTPGSSNRSRSSSNRSSSSSSSTTDEAPDDPEDVVKEGETAAGEGSHREGGEEHGGLPDPSSSLREDSGDKDHYSSAPQPNQDLSLKQALPRPDSLPPIAHQSPTVEERAPAPPPPPPPDEHRQQHHPPKEKTANFHNNETQQTDPRSHNFQTEPQQQSGPANPVSYPPNTESRPQSAHRVAASPFEMMFGKSLQDAYHQSFGSLFSNLHRPPSQSGTLFGRGGMSGGLFGQEAGALQGRSGERSGGTATSGEDIGDQDREAFDVNSIVNRRPSLRLFGN